MYHFITTLHLTSTNCTRETCYLAAKNVFFFLEAYEIVAFLG